jgi:tripartite ATP-independent transporter DctP family solute receptor
VLQGIGASLVLTASAHAADSGSHSSMIATDVHVAAYPTVQAMHWMSDYLQRETDGRLSFRVMHSGQLGRENDTVDLVRYGVIDLTRVYIGAVNNAVPESQLLALPYLFDSSAHMRRVVDGVVGTQVLAAMQRRGLVGLALYDAGPRCFYNNRHAIHEPQDLHGLKLRVPVSDIFIELVRTFGGNPTPLAYSDTYSALQTHLIDGAENNWSSFQSSRHFEVAKFWTQSEHSYAPDILLMSEQRFNRMTADDQALVRYAAAQSVQYMRGLWDVDEQRARQLVIAAGTHISEVDKAAFRKVSAPILERYRQRTELRSMFAAISALS